MSKNITLYILVIVLGIAFIFLSLTPSNDYVPYDNQQHMYSTYESMTENAEDQTENENEEEEVEEEEIEGFGVFEGNEGNEEDEEVEEGEEVEIENFEPIIDVAQTINYGPFRDSAIIDKFSQITANGMDGVNGCVSSGLSNAGGYICLSPELINLLKTRGGNAAGGECLSKCSSSK